MDSAQTQKASSSNLFQVFLRLRPPHHTSGHQNSERFLTVEPSETDTPPTHITLNPPNDRRRAIERFAFTQVFEEDATQLDVFHCTRVAPLIEGVIAPHGGYGTDALVATLGVTGSGKSHTILGSRTQRGLTQLSLDVIFRSIGNNLVDPNTSASLESTLQVSDTSEASISCASSYLETMFSDPLCQSTRGGSRAATPMIVGNPSFFDMHPSSEDPFQDCPKSIRIVERTPLRTFHPAPRSPSWGTFNRLNPETPKRVADTRHYMTLTASTRVKKVVKVTKTEEQGEHSAPPMTPRRLLQMPSTPSVPDVSGVNVSSDPSSEYAVVMSMYEVYNDRIFDLLTPPARSNATKEYRRRPLMFKSTEASPDRKVVAGLRKVVCGSFNEALMVLEAGLHERRVAGTGSNSVSSRSHGFICIEVKKRQRSSRRQYPWGGNTLTVVDLAGSERARDAKTQGATLAEAGKINESLMYLGQCLQMQSDSGSSTKPNIVPFRQCKLTELLFSNSFPSATSQAQGHRRNPQKAVMIVTADPLGDFNATSQILRYSALAREVTVPRIPSIFSNPPSSQPESRQPLSPNLGLHHRPPFFGGPGSGSGSHRNISPASSHPDGDRATMELAALEIARLTEEIDILRGEVARESEGRVAAEAHLLSMEDRMLELEQVIREDCAAEFEKRLALEMARWKASLQLEQERGEEHWDRKVELLERGLVGTEADEEDKENVLVEDLEQENERLRREIAVLKRELNGRSPSKRVPLQERDDVPQSSEGHEREGGVERLGARMERLRVSNESTASAGSRNSRSASPTKKVRRLVAKKWEDASEEVA
ncbi:hypothetical protein jhhlp_006780 [Lomentospora prolificans]|uniref:Kinesin motor domain-containing protein n=1 Tax=Lomentospora prolificans TaxID=41688 RepID=A0A2N3N2P6_9PEZI|nr:hypothetical protein jhhlp_006780 [Lomentospora prolificans]